MRGAHLRFVQALRGVAAGQVGAVDGPSRLRAKSAVVFTVRIGLPVLREASLSSKCSALKSSVAFPDSRFFDMLFRSQPSSDKTNVLSA